MLISYLNNVFIIDLLNILIKFSQVNKICGICTFTSNSHPSRTITRIGLDAGEGFSGDGVERVKNYICGVGDGLTIFTHHPPHLHPTPAYDEKVYYWIYDDARAGLE